MKQHKISWTRGATLLVISLTLVMAIVASAQSTVPPTARQAAQSPAFTSKLHPSAGRNPQHPSHPRPRPASPQDVALYDNGPINGSVDAWTLNYGYAVTDSFTLTSAATITGFTFGVWVYPADIPRSIDFSIGTSPFGGAPSTVGLTDTFQYVNQYGYDIDWDGTSGLSIPLGPGTYWLTLQNAVTALGNPLYWDENSGPSQAEESSLGTIPSESFTVIGTTEPPPPDCSTPTVISNIDYGYLEGVTMDKAGNLYGAASSQQLGNPGMVYKLSSKDPNWIFDPLYNFTGGYDGNYIGSVVLGPNDTESGIYGAAYYGGIQDCQGGCGLVFRLVPEPNACRTALCSWNEDVLHRFSLSDGTWSPWGNLVFDQAGNLYGTAYDADNQTTVYELTPSLAGWTLKVLYSFPQDTLVDSLLLGMDGNLYGVAEWGSGCEWGCVFQLTPSGSGWTRQDIFTFTDRRYGYYPHNLVQDSSGNLDGFYQVDDTCLPSGYQYSFGNIYQLARSAGGWEFRWLGYFGYYAQSWGTGLAIDKAGNLYATTSHYGGESCDHNDYDSSTVWESNGSSLQPVFGSPFFETGGPLTVDKDGNLYGTGYCRGSSGVVWTVPHPQRLAK